MIKKLLWLLGSIVVVAIAILAYMELSAESKTLADVSSPTGAWRVVVRGKDVWGGVEVTAVVHTQGNRRIPLGVIDLRQEWPETEHFYQADKTFHTRIDEVKAIVGDRILFRDNYFPGEEFGVSGTIKNQPVNLRIGNVNNQGFHFASTNSLIPTPSVSIQFVDFPKKLAPGAIFEVQASGTEGIPLPDITCYWRDSDSGQLRVESNHRDISMRLEVAQVTEHVVTGNVKIVGKDPDVDLSGNFRLVTQLPLVSDNSPGEPKWQ